MAVFGPDLTLYPADEQTLEELAEDQEFMQNFMSFSWARQYLMIKHNLMRDREEPDR